jgi:TolA-binding protein
VATGVDGNGNVVYSDKIVDYKYETINKTNSGSAAYNASNASSSSSSTSSVDLDQSVIDKYEDLDNAIDVLKDKLSDLQDAQDDLFGDELIDNLKQQKEAIEEITKATQKEISAMTAGQKTEQAYLKN